MFHTAVIGEMKDVKVTTPMIHFFMRLEKIASQ